MRFINLFKDLAIYIFLILQVNIAYSFDFKGYELGMKLSDFKRKGVHEDVFLVKTYDKFFRWEPTLICSDDVRTEFRIELRGYPDDSVVVCAVKEQAISAENGSARSMYSEGYMWLKLSSGTYPISPKFTFVSIKQDEEPVLSAIYFSVSSDNFHALNEAVMEKYKKPVNQNSEVVQNAFGAKFRNEKYTWKDAASLIEIYKYSGGTLEKSSINYQLIIGEKKLSNLRKQKSNDSSKGL